MLYSRSKGKLRGIEDKNCVNWIIKKLKLEDYASKKAKHLSLGNAQRLGIAKAIIHKPKILILDEPTNIGIIHDGKLVKEIDGKELTSQLKKLLIIDGKDIIAIKSILSKAGYKVDLRDKSLTEEFLALQIQNEYAVNNPEKIATLLVNAGYPPTLLKVEKEVFEMYFLTMLALTLVPFIGGFFMFILKDPSLAQKMEFVSAKAYIIGTADWPSYFSLLAQAIAIGGLLVFGFITSWIFGREYSDRTIKDLLALSISRNIIVFSKFIIWLLCCMTLH